MKEKILAPLLAAVLYVRDFAAFLVGDISLAVYDTKPVEKHWTDEQDLEPMPGEYDVSCQCCTDDYACGCVEEEDADFDEVDEILDRIGPANMDEESDIEESIRKARFVAKVWRKKYSDSASQLFVTDQQLKSALEAAEFWKKLSVLRTKERIEAGDEIHRLDLLVDYWFNQAISDEDRLYVDETIAQAIFMECLSDVHFLDESEKLHASKGSAERFIALLGAYHFGDEE